MYHMDFMNKWIGLYDKKREEVLEVREKRLRKRNIKEYLIKWKNLPIEDATWESEQVLQETGSELLVGKQFLAGKTVIFPHLLMKRVGETR